MFDLQIQEVFYLQIEELSTDGRTICILKKYVQIEEALSQQIEELSAY